MRLIDADALIEALLDARRDETDTIPKLVRFIEKLPTAESKRRYTEEDLMVFQHGISLRLLSKRSAQHWRYDADTAKEIEFLERLYDKVSADMKGRQG